MHEGLSDLYGASPEACAAARAYSVRQAEHLAETRLADSPYLMGNRFNAADLLLPTCLDWARFAKIELDEALTRYRKRVPPRLSARRPSRAVNARHIEDFRHPGLGRCRPTAAPANDEVRSLQLPRSRSAARRVH